MTARIYRTAGAAIALAAAFALQSGTARAQGGPPPDDVPPMEEMGPQDRPPRPERRDGEGMRDDRRRPPEREGQGDRPPRPDGARFDGRRDGPREGDDRDRDRDWDGDRNRDGERMGPPRDDERDGRDGRYGGRFNIEPLSDEQAEQLLAVLDDYKPEMAERIRSWQGERSDGSNRGLAMMLRHNPMLRRLMYERENNPEIYAYRISDLKLERETHELAEEFRGAKEANAEAEKLDATRKALAAKVDEHFEVRRKLREYEISRLEERIAELREQLKERDAQAAALKSQRVGELIGDEDRPQF